MHFASLLIQVVKKVAERFLFFFWQNAKDFLRFISLKRENLLQPS
jgi:hypothetical protein